MQDMLVAPGLRTLRQSTQPTEWVVQYSADTTERSFYFTAKRVLDVAISFMALICLAPLFALVALAIRLDSRGPVFFRQSRMGYDRRTGQLRPFMFVKFRSMTHNCDQGVHREFVKRWVQAQGTAAESNNNKVDLLAHDRRVTRVGRFLRRTSVDELPQLWNVLRGEMSLVGPRPVPVYETEFYRPEHMARLKAVPGITCLWQVMARGQVSLDEWVALDSEYIENQSLALDVKILALTIPAVLSGHGAM